MFKLSNVKLSRAGRVLLDIPKLEFSERAITSIIGANGAGKSTLFKVLLAEIVIDRGIVLFDDKPLGSMTLVQLSQKRAYIAQAQRPNFSATVVDFLKLARYSRQESLADTNHWLSVIVSQHQIEELLPRNILTLSGGEFQRIEFARACLQLIDHRGYQGKVLLLDEPSSALDIKQTKRLYDQLRSFNADGGTVLVIEHNINYAANFSDRMMVITAGRLSALGHTHEVFNKRVLDSCFDTNGQVISTPNAVQSNYHYVLTPQQRGNNQQEINHE